ncbi:hypothetical protein GU335_07825 [Pseudolactococcus raffinolactis]|uniref:hypothetical protein n=1 Tax=Pseudolactococcus raffinolactis TaxID=1366 RepID=UPI0014370191|nr:hypothetical protein [Lactococcus raffinolactis]QIW56492.1 hypothetical protein GU335_07825 [Lactococcus raffinolactis]
MNEEAKFYFCYNSRYAELLKARGFKAITTAINPKSMNTFWLYMRTNEFEQALEQIK